MELYVSFRGEEPRTDALLRHRGLVGLGRPGSSCLDTAVNSKID